ncbi:ATP-grasp peptide maturase system methyltransferase [Streptomyces sp. NBC_00289]|uniref:ATP-grasp peptide maturase system methyltransferase n=1 Tax=Streptomyces sp. NBC_00289 TaxID=2975703 RepID=UPI00324CD07B
MSDEERLHQQLIDRLTADGYPRTAAWRHAARTVRRHEFLRGGYFRRVPGAPSAWAPVLEGEEGWLEGCYTDESLVTQIAGTIVPADVRGHIMREPTSSSTLPSLVLRMLEDLHVQPDDRVLEIGTGTGYSTALLCTRLGAQHLTSVEYDHDVAARAHTALAGLGMHPALVTGDGLLGHPEGAPYDRIIATCAVRTIPATWLEQTRPGGLILATISGWLGSSELACLTVHEDGTATGKLLGGQVAFMLARPHQPPPAGLLPDLTTGQEHQTPLPPKILDDWTARFIIQLALPHTQRLTLHHNGHTEDVLIDTTTGSFAALHEENGHCIIRQHGTRMLWDTAEDHLARWHTAGTPTLRESTLHITPHNQTIHW